jgi:hypothetical protein
VRITRVLVDLWVPCNAIIDGRVSRDRDEMSRDYDEMPRDYDEMLRDSGKVPRDYGKISLRT